MKLQELKRTVIKMQMGRTGRFFAVVTRRLNKPVGGTIAGESPFWMHQVISSEWRCRKCYGEQPKLSVAFEMQGKKGKTYLCLPCAKKVLEDALDRVAVCDRLGPEAFVMFEEM